MSSVVTTIDYSHDVTYMCMNLFSLIDPATILFVAALVLSGSALTLVFLIGNNSSLVRPLMGVLMVLLFCLFGTVALEFSAASTPSYILGAFEDVALKLSTHRWLLFQLPILLTMMALIVLSAYHDRISQKHAGMYRASVIVAVCVIFASLLVIGLESYV